MTVLDAVSMCSETRYAMPLLTTYFVPLISVLWFSWTMWIRKRW